MTQEDLEYGDSGATTITEVVETFHRRLVAVVDGRISLDGRYRPQAPTPEPRESGADPLSAPDAETGQTNIAADEGTAPESITEEICPVCEKTRPRLVKWRGGLLCPECVGLLS